MAKLIAIDDGHGTSTSGKRTPILPSGLKSETGKNYMNENLFNRAVAKHLKAELERCGFRTLMVAPTDSDTALATRTATANKAKADLYVSIHANANAGKWGSHGGTETFVGSSSESKRIGKIIHKHLMKGTKLRDRGVKDGSHLYVLRTTNMPAVLLECAFMDNLVEAKLLLSDAFRKECAKETAMAICEAFKVKYVPATTAKKAVDKPKTETKTETKKPATELYRVRKSWKDEKSQKGAFTVLKTAKDLADKNAGYKVFNEKGTVVYEPKKVGVTHTVKKGDTLSALAKKYGVTVASIKSKNKLKNDTIVIGDKLVIK